MATDEGLEPVALSPERLAPYRQVCGDDLQAMLRLYEWNVTISGAFYEALGVTEVVLRNALHAQLTAHHGALPGYWYDDPLDVLSDIAHDDIITARQRVRRFQRRETPGRVVAELNFGFWKFCWPSATRRRYGPAISASRSRVFSHNVAPLSTVRWTAYTRCVTGSPTTSRFTSATGTPTC